MSDFLRKLGDVAFRKPWLVIGVWLVILAGLGGGTYVNMKPTTSSISIPGTEAQVAIDRAKELFPDSGSGSGRIVFYSTDGKIEQHRQAIDKLVESVSKVNGVAQVVSPFASRQFIAKSGDIAYAQIQLDGIQGSVRESTLAGVRSAVDEARGGGLQVDMAGDLIDRKPGDIIGIGEMAGVAIALMVLLITLGSLVAAGMPIISAVLAIGVSMTGLFALSQVIEISSTTPVLAIMLGLAVGIDYSLFIVNRYRSYVVAGLSYREAAAKSIATAGNAVIFAAMTVVIALAALSVVNIPFMTTMGLAGAGSIAIAAAVAVTLIPALLGLFGSRVFSRKIRKSVRQAQSRKGHAVKINKNTVWYKWGLVLTKRPIAVLAVAIVAIALMAIPAKDLQLGLPTDQFAAQDSTQRRAYDLITKGFGEGYNGPLVVVVEGLPAVSESDKQAIRQPAIQQLNKQIAKAQAKQESAMMQQMQQAVTLEQQMALQEQVVTMQTKGKEQKQAALTEIEKQIEQYAKLVQLKLVADKLTKIDNVSSVTPAMATTDGTKGLIQVIPSTAPSSQATADLISKLRSEDIKNTTESSSVTLAVTGSTALERDINQKLAAAIPQYLAVVVGLSLILLVVAFRSILIPIKATLGFLLSVMAMFGALVAVFQLGWFGIAAAPGPIVSFIPIIATGILFGLAMDYEFFLVSSMHEAYEDTKDAKKAVVDGMASGGKVVVAAAVIMVSVFAGFVTNHDSTIQAIGFALAVGIFIDAFVVRMTIVPVVMHLLSSSAWWMPKWLKRFLPNVSIEGK